MVSLCPPVTEAKLIFPDFTFALERGRSYTIGRDKGCDIQFNSKRLRTHEGVLEVGDWSLTDVSCLAQICQVTAEG
jgi:hypothetical protein